MNRRTIQILLTAIIFFVGCDSKNRVDDKIDIEKRNALVKKYNLINFHSLKEPVFLTIDEFFDGNNDEGSIAPNLSQKPRVSEYYNILKRTSDNPKTIKAFVQIKDVVTYENGKLNDNEWLYTDIIYFIGDLTKEEIREATKSLLPDEVEYYTGNINGLNEKHKNKRVVSVWWD